MDPDPIEDMLEDVGTYALFLEFQLEDWPLLTRLTPEEKNHLYAEVKESFNRLEGSVEAVNVIRDELHLVARMSPNHPFQESMDALEAIAEQMAANRENCRGFSEMSVVSISPTDVVDSVVRIQGAMR